MTKVNVLLPLCELNVVTNNSEIITKTLKQYYCGLNIEGVFWIDQGNKKDKEGKYQCVVRVKEIAVNFEQIVQNSIKVHKLEASIARMKGDLFNFVKQYDLVLQEKNSYLAKLDKIKQQPKDYSQDASVSLKIDDKLRKSPSFHQQTELKEKQLLNAVSELTRENIKLKDMLSYSQAHIQFLLKGEEKTLDKKTGDK